MNTAKVFWSRRSQAVRVPKEFRFATEEVRIRRHGQAVILEPIATDWAWLDALIGPLDKDFVQAATETPEEQERSASRQLPRTSCSSVPIKASGRGKTWHEWRRCGFQCWISTKRTLSSLVGFGQRSPQLVGQSAPMTF